MINNYIYDSESKTFSIGSKVVGALTSNKASAVQMGLGLATTGIGMHQAMKGYGSKVRFSVVFVESGGPQHVSVKANSPIDATQQVKSKHPTASKIKAFRLPDQDDQSQEYYQSLS